MTNYLSKAKTIIWEAIFGPETLKFEKKLSESEKANINQIDEIGGQTLLHKAVLEKDNAKVDLLIDAGIDVNYISNAGSTALTLAAFDGNNEVIKSLIKAGADVNYALYSGETSLSIAIANKNYETAKILVEGGADVNHSSCGRTPLCNTIIQGNSEFAKFLIEKGASNIADENGNTPLYLAIDKGYNDIVLLLTKPEMDVSYTEQNEYDSLYDIISEDSDLGTDKVTSLEDHAQQKIVGLDVQG